jgi:hypothetical protein
MVSAQDTPAARCAICANCGAPLGGEYCAACGQRHEPRVHSVRHFFAEAFESLTHADSRLWRTLWYLLARPGKLTLEFFQGHRVRYLPPFRLYLVISVVFFLVAGMPENINVNIAPAQSTEGIQGMKDVASALENEFNAAAPAASVVQDTLRAQAAQDEAAPAEDTTAPQGLRDQNLISEICKEFEKADPNASRDYARMHKFCSRPPMERTQAIGKALVDNLPRVMFVFLPLLALSMKPLYWRPKRYYVEHLLLLVHNHAFVFLALTIVYLLQRIPVVGEYLGPLEFAAWLYIIWYIFRAMRVYYAQSRTLTFGKYLTIGLAYFTTSIVVLSVTSVFLALML